jgi:hypothetical protein
MRAGRLVAGVSALALIAVVASWATFEREYVVRQYATAEWQALTLADQALAKGRGPQGADAAFFLSNKVMGEALKQIVHAKIKAPGEKLDDLEIVVDDARLKPDVGLTGAVVDVTAKSAKHGIDVKLTLDGDLMFRGVTRKVEADGRSAATANFALNVLRVEPHLKWGFADYPGRRFLSEAIASGLMLALDNRLTVSIPFQDRLAINTGFSSQSTVHAQDGTVTLNASLPGKALEQRFSYDAPLFIRSGVWLMASISPAGQTTLTPPPATDLQPADLDSKIATLRERITAAVRDLEQDGDFVMLLKSKVLVGLVEQLASLPEGNRTVSITPTNITGHLVDDGTLLVELPDTGALNARVAVEGLRAAWMPEKGIALGADIRMGLDAKIHVHVKPVVNAGTTLGLEGGASKHVEGTLKLSNAVINGHSLLILDTGMPCDSVTADVTTDGHLVVGPVKTDLVKVGVRWTLPTPPALGEPNVIFDDLPRRLAINATKPDAKGVTIEPAHKGVEFAAHVTEAKATQTGYVVAAKIDLRPVDTLETPPDIAAQQRALAESVKAGHTCPTVDSDMKVLFGGLEFGKNNELVKAVTNIIHDVLHGPGRSNDLVGPDGFVAKKTGDIAHDILHGPGPSNDLVGRNGAVRRFLGF